MNTDEKILVNDLTKHGLRRIHVVSSTGPVECDRYLEMVPDVARDEVYRYEHKEEGLGYWHLWLLWKAREVVHLPCDLVLVNQSVLGVLWWIGKDFLFMGMAQDRL